MVNRLNEYVWYHINGDADANPLVLRQYIKNKKLNPQDRLDLCYFYSITYSLPSAALLLKSRNFIRDNPQKWATLSGQRLIFQSDRRWVRMNHGYEKCLEFWKSHIDGKFVKVHKSLTISGVSLNPETAIKQIESWVCFGRYSAYLFAETYEVVFGLKSVNEKNVEFDQGRTFSAGILNVFGEDALANLTDKKKSPMPAPLKYYDQLLNIIIGEVKDRGGEYSSYQIETSLCGYRKHFKGSRYNGYYADRQLGEIYKMLSLNPEMGGECDELLKARSQALKPEYLGELGGWRGIRNELKKAYLSDGRVIGYGV